MNQEESVFLVFGLFFYVRLKRACLSLFCCDLKIIYLRSIVSMEFQLIRLNGLASWFHRYLILIARHRFPHIFENAKKETDGCCFVNNDRKMQGLEL
jgi:hypothetical protein